jgi:hypothetical protein
MLYPERRRALPPALRNVPHVEWAWTSEAKDGGEMGALAIALWVIALTGGVFFPPLFVPPIFATFLWLKQVNARQRARASMYPEQAQQRPAGGMTNKALVLVLAIVGVLMFIATVELPKMPDRQPTRLPLVSRRTTAGPTITIGRIRPATRARLRHLTGHVSTASIMPPMACPTISWGHPLRSGSLATRCTAT